MRRQKAYTSSLFRLARSGRREAAAEGVSAVLLPRSLTRLFRARVLCEAKAGVDSSR
jgi:hypothetical protein